VPPPPLSLSLFLSLSIYVYTYVHYELKTEVGYLFVFLNIFIIVDRLYILVGFHPVYWICLFETFIVSFIGSIWFVFQICSLFIQDLVPVFLIVKSNTRYLVLIDC